MDPVFAFYSGPNSARAAAIHTGKGAHSIPVYEGYGILSRLANRTAYSLLRTDLPQQVGGGCLRSRKRRAESMPFDMEQQAKKKQAGKGISKAMQSRSKPRGRSRKRGSKKARASSRLFQLFNQQE